MENSKTGRTQDFAMQWREDVEGRCPDLVHLRSVKPTYGVFTMKFMKFREIQSFETNILAK